MVTGINTSPLEPGEDMTTVINFNRPNKSVASGSSLRIAYWERAMRDVGKLKAEIEDLKKVSKQTGNYFYVYSPFFKFNA